MRVTAFDRHSAFMISVVVALIVVVIAVVAWWLTVRPPPPPALVPMEIVDASGGFEDGAIDETMNIESPLEEIPNAAPVEEQTDELMIEETLDSVVELSDRASQQVQDILASDAESAGVPGSLSGTGGKPLGEGLGFGGVPRENRWFVRFADDKELSEYARQLDHFKIELGAVFPREGKLVYLYNLSKNPPDKRTVTSDKDELRLYMNWQGGRRKEADEQLFQRAGVNIDGAHILHFYPRETEELLARLELAHANRSVQEIRRTYFVVVPQGRGFTFAVTRQSYFR